MKTYNQTNFFKYTFCEFTEVDNFIFPENKNYKSKSESLYFYTEEGVYRKSNHWGRVANSRWKLIAKENYKNQNTVIGFAKWNSFYPINSSEKTFFIEVNFDEKMTKIQPKKEDSNQYSFNYSEAQKKMKQITQLFKDDKWAKHFDLEIEELRFKIISQYINSERSLQEIKRSFN